jgi:glutamine cyclotransferase
MSLKSIKIILGITLLTLFVSCTDTGEAESTTPALFAFRDNLATSFNTEVVVEIEIFSKDIQLIQVLISDSLIQEWKNPKTNLSLKINTSNLGIGAKQFDLKINYENGKSYTDSRLLKVLSDVEPENWSLSIINSYPHNVANFTQGFEFNDGILYESTGQQGESKVAKIDLKTGNDILKMGLDATHFGEGITIFGDLVYQITWQTGRCFTYDKKTLEPKLKEFNYNGEGWGLCNDGKSIIMSDGSERITFRDPKTFSVQRVIEVYTNKEPLINLNELEYIDGFIYANIWMSPKVIVIDPNSGKVVAVIDGTELVKKGRGQFGDTMNGIAYNLANGKLYMTGKKWEKTFEVLVYKGLAN